jgi:threonine aldolase
MPDAIDLRSDTVTLPTPGMRRAMSRAKVGDAKRGEDPSVRELEEHAASLFGKEAALFVPSGTMGNLVSVAAWTRPGDRIVASSSSHIAGREEPGMANLAAVTVVGIDTPEGVFTVRDVEEAIAGAAAPPGSAVRLVAAENTHNAAGGTVFPLSALRALRAFCRRSSLRFHIDGSRIFNASVASGVGTAEYGKACDSLMFCLTKGLGAPVGSVVVGPRDFIEEARAVSHRVGGGMRQSGIVAAGGLYALGRHVERLAVDHENARALARSLAEIPGIEIVNRPVRTNIVLFRWANPSMPLPEFRDRLRAKGVQADDRAFPLVRAVTHLGIGKREIARAARALREVLAAEGGKSSFAPHRS